MFNGFACSGVQRKRLNEFIFLFWQGVPGENGGDGERGVQGPDVSLSKRTVPVIQRRVLPVPLTSAYKPPPPVLQRRVLPVPLTSAYKPPPLVLQRRVLLVPLTSAYKPHPPVLQRRVLPVPLTSGHKPPPVLKRKLLPISSTYKLHPLPPPPHTHTLLYIGPFTCRQRKTFVPIYIHD